MRRWNGWGDDTTDAPVPAQTGEVLKQLVGHGQPSADVSLARVVALAAASPTRLQPHPLILTEPLERVRHARGQSLPDLIAIRSGRHLVFPDGVAYPTCRADVQALLSYAGAVGAAVIPYGGGTSVVGHINPQPSAAPVLTVDLSRFNRLEKIDTTSLLATFGAGVNGPEIEAQLRAKGYTLGHFPQSFELSTLGGWIASRSSGQQSLYYGRIERLFAGGTIETPAGTVELPSFPASAAGPDLRETIMGSEGRIGIITSATVRISPLAEREIFQGIFFPTFEQAMAAARTIIQARLPVSMLRVSTAMETRTTLALSGHDRVIQAVEKLLRLRGLGDEKSLVVLGVTGTHAMVKTVSQAALDLIHSHGGVRLGPIGASFGQGWRRGRFLAPYLRNTLWERGYAIDTVETATNWSNIPMMIAAIEAALRDGLAAQDERVHAYTHLSHLYSQGASVYTTYVYRAATDPDETLHRWQLLKDAASKAIVTHGGTISHQHGVGTDHAPYLAEEKSVLGMQAIHAVHSTFDPSGMMNPGKLIIGRD